ncbi:MAG: hypothetical protein K2P78_01525, partial [Gemmataceae bacterium]|nr:hypothetical protein [Gemmataceae bacterium]
FHLPFFWGGFRQPGGGRGGCTRWPSRTSHGKHVPINHQETFGIGVAHINGIEGFWSYAERLYRHVHGVGPGNVPLDLAEYESRYDHRGEHLMTLLDDHLIRTAVPTQTQPENVANHPLLSVEPPSPLPPTP